MKNIVFGCLVLLALTACHVIGYDSRSEGLVTYLVETMEDYRGREIDVNIPKELESVTWKLKEDSGGIQILLDKEYIDQLDELIRAALGDPSWVSKDQADNSQIHYHINDAGFALRYGLEETSVGEPNWVHLIMLRPTARSRMGS